MEDKTPENAKEPGAVCEVYVEWLQREVSATPALCAQRGHKHAPTWPLAYMQKGKHQ